MRTSLLFASHDDAGARAQWTRLLATSPDAQAHADPRWLDVLARAFGVRAVIALTDDGAAGAAGYYSRTLRGQRLFHSLRHGVLGEDAALLPDLAAHLRAEGCIQAPVGGGLVPLSGNYRASTRTAMRLDLSAGAENVWDSFRDKVRNTVRKAEKSALEVSRERAHLHGFHPIYAHAMTEKRANVRSFAFFCALFDVFGADARLYSALDNGRSCGAMVVVTSGKQAVYPFGAFDETGRKRGANTLLLWNVARDLAQEGLESLDLGPSAQDSGSYRFKIHVGGTPQTLHYVDLMRPPAAQTAPRAFSPAPNRLDRAIEMLPRPMRVQARTWLGRTGRLL